MRPPRPFALVRTEDQWRRAAHKDTALIGEIVQLAWSDETSVDLAGPPPPPGAGLAFDDHCRLFHSVPEEGRVERLLWAAEEPAAPLDFFSPGAPQQLGDFRRTENAAGDLPEPRSLAVDENERLFVADARGRRVLIYDLWSRRLLREVRFEGRPIDLARAGSSVFVLLESPAAILELDARSRPRSLALPDDAAGPSRLAVSAAGEVFVLDHAGADDATIFASGRPAIQVPRATDIEFQSHDALIVARFPREDFRAFRAAAAATDELPGLKARYYDGRGIVRTPAGRIGFWTARGFRHAVAARLKYLRKGRVTSFRLDSGEFQTVWGRLFLDACIPRETRLRVHCVAADEPPEDPPLPRTPPTNTGTMTIIRPDLSPPMPPKSLVPDDDKITQALHRRESGRELPWSPMAANDPFETYEAPIATGHGRYLWVTLLLEGNSRFTPRVRSLRAEYPSHDLLRRIPKIFSRDAEAAGFLRRYLAMLEGFLAELEGEDGARHSLIDPRSAPEEALRWLASFVGLVLDERWPVAARRQLIEEAIWLFRFRGTVEGLKRFLKIYLGRDVILIEKYRVRGLGGAIVGESSGLLANSVLGAGFRIGGAVGESEVQILGVKIDDAFATHAHRFTVVIPAALGESEIAVVQHILEVHRPAHTLVEVCTVGAGMRVGRGLHIELTSLIGRTGGFEPLQMDRSVLGRGSIVGRPGAGTVPGASQLGEDSRVG